METRPFALRGKGPLVIVAGKEIPAFVTRELHDHLQQVGSDPKLAADAASGAIRLELDDRLPREHHRACIEQGQVRLSGGDPRGLYHAVLTFLEALGWRWLAPGEWGTVRPADNAFTLPPDWCDEGAPAMRWRGLHICGTGRDGQGQPIFHYDDETALWMSRNRFNFKPIHIDEFDEAAPLLAEKLLTPLAFGHSYSAWIPADTYDSHPEWFPLVDGHRLRDGQRCLSNPQLREEWARRIIAYAKAHPSLPILSLAPNDGYRWCTCPACQAMDTAGDRERQELNRRNHAFSADMARRLREACPETALCTLSYCNYLEPADDLPEEPNLAISICAMQARNRSLDDPSCDLNRTYLQRLDAWLAKAGQVFWSDYQLSYGGTLPQAFDAQMLATIRTLVSHGVSGLKTEVVPGHHPRWRANAWPLYLLGRALVDPGLDVDRLRSDFCRHAYGSAAEAGDAIFACHRRAAASLAEPVTSVGPQHLPQIYPPERLSILRSLADNARGAAAVTPCMLEPLLAQIDEVAAGCQASREAAAEAVPLRAINLEPDLRDAAATLDWRPQRQRSNLLPFQPPSCCAIAWSEDWLWLCFHLGEPDMDVARHAIHGEQGAFAGSNVDCFICPPGDDGTYYQLAVNILGTPYSARCRQRQWDSGYDLEPRIDVHYLESAWLLRVGLSWQRLGLNATAGDCWRLALNRGQQCDSPRTLGGWPNGGAWHKPEQMGDIHFA